MNYRAAAKHIEKHLGLSGVKVRPQNKRKYSAPALLCSKGLPSDAIVWAYRKRKDGSTHWIGCFIKNVYLDWGELLPLQVFHNPPLWRARGDEYTFFCLS